MRRLSLFVMFGAMLAMLLPLGAQPASAQSPPPWQTGSWSGVGTTAAVTNITGPETLHVTDFECLGDRFTVLVDGTPIGSTSATPMPDECADASIDEACASGIFSSGSFAIPAGTHSVEIRHLSGFEVGQVAYRTGPVGCNNVVPAQGGLFLGATALCIEDDYVQANAQGQRVGNVFPGGPDRVLIATGPPTCQFNCLDGFDVNCDGKIGDFCPVELDRSLVDDVRPCLEALNPSVPAEPPAAAAPVAIAVGSTTLAHTGSETDALLVIGTAMLGLGAVAVGAARRTRRSDHLDVDTWLDD